MRCQPFARLVVAGSFCLAATAATAHGVGTGGTIPTDLAATSGTLTSDIVISTTGTVASGNAVTVNLLGLQHDWAGDLVVTLSYLDAQGNTVRSVDLINRVGLNSGHTFGTAADFGDGRGVGDNYLFNTGYPGDIWANAACSDPPGCTTPLGDADVIPGQTNDAANGGRYFSSTTGGARSNLSSFFTGLDVSAGKWRLTITDAADPNRGSFVGWEIFIQTAQTIAPFAGTPQSAGVNSAFATALQAKVTDGGNPVSGVTVTFTAPSTGASGTFTGTGTNTATAVTIASGVATAPAFTANGTVGGPYTVTATATGAGTANFSLTNSSAPGSISIVRSAGGCYAALVQGEPTHATTWTISPQFGTLRVVPFWIGVIPSSLGSTFLDQYDMACYVPATSGTFPDHVTLTATSSADPAVTASINLDPHTGNPK